MQFVDIIVAVLFAIVAIAILGYLGLVIPELMAYLKQNAKLAAIFSFIFDAAPVQKESKKTQLPLQVTIEGLIPIVFWLLILLPMFIYPVVLIIFPIKGIPWTNLLPPAP